MPNPQRLEEIKHYYVDQNVPVTEIARIIWKKKKGKNKPKLDSIRSGVNWYIKTYNLKRKEVKPF